MDARELSLLTGMDERKISTWSKPLSAAEQERERKAVAGAREHKVIPRMPFVMLDEKRGRMFRVSDVSRWMQRFFGQGWGYGEGWEVEGRGWEVESRGSKVEG